MNACPNCETPLTQGARFCPSCGSAVPSVPDGEEADPLLGKVIARNFRVESLLGTGGMGRVYKARQISLDKPIVLKVLHPHFNNDPQLVQRFQREARAASRLNHPNSISIIDFGQADDGTLFMAMELLHGKDLFTLLQDEFPLAEDRLARIMIQVCSALAEAHAQNIIHRDLKPENIMVEDRRDQKDFVKVLDFGIAKIQDPGEGEGRALTQQGMVCGTPEYMSPEQARGEELDPRSDVYALGVLMFQLVTGDLPFKAETAIGIVTKHITEPPPLPRSVRPDLEISEGVQNIILKCLEKHRERRYQTATELGEAWKAWLEARQHPPRASFNAEQPTRRSTMAMGTAMSFPPPEPVAVQPTPGAVSARTEASFPSAPAPAAVLPPSSATQPSLSSDELTAVRGRSPGLYMGVAGAALLAVAGLVFAFGGAPADGPVHTPPVASTSGAPVAANTTDPPPPVEQQKDPPPAEQHKDPEPAQKDPPKQAEARDPPRKDPPKHTEENKPKQVAAEEPRQPARDPDPPRQQEPEPTPEPTEDPGRAEAIRELIGRGEKRLNAGDYEEAIKLLEQARTADPSESRAARLLGDAFLASGDPASACPHWKDFVKLAPKDPKVRSIKSRLKLCR